MKCLVISEIPLGISTKKNNNNFFYNGKGATEIFKIWCKFPTSLSRHMIGLINMRIPNFVNKSYNSKLFPIIFSVYFSVFYGNLYSRVNLNSVFFLYIIIMLSVKVILIFGIHTVNCISSSCFRICMLQSYFCKILNFL